MKRTFIVVIALFALLTVSAFADSGNCGEELSWTLSEGVLTISGSGAMKNYSYDSTPWYKERDSITSIVIGHGVTDICAYAFYKCKNALSITVSDTVTNIGNSAFYDCDAIQSIYIDSIKSWCDISFGNEKSNPMYSGANLYCKNTLVWELIIPDSVSAIGSYQFCGCESIKYLVCPTKLDSIGEHAFSNCTALISAAIPADVMTVKSDTFSNCTAMTSIIIAQSVKKIESSAFGGCVKLLNIYSGCAATDEWKNNTDIGYKAFPESCTVRCGCCMFSWSLSDAGVLTIYGSGKMSAFTDGVTPWSDMQDKIELVVIKNGIESIPGKAFANCIKLKSVTIPSTVKNIGTDAFQNCVALRQINYQGTNADWKSNIIRLGGNDVLNSISPQRVYLLGDTDKNDIINADDVSKLFSHILKPDILDDISVAISDVNSSGNADIGDVQAIYMHINGGDKIPETLTAE